MGDWKDETFTYVKKVSDSCPHSIIGNLSPAPLMHDGSLICNTADQVDGRCDQCSKWTVSFPPHPKNGCIPTGWAENIHHPKNSTWPERLLDLAHATTSRHGFSFEEISTLVLAGANER